VNLLDWLGTTPYRARFGEEIRAASECYSAITPFCLFGIKFLHRSRQREKSCHSLTRIFMGRHAIRKPMLSEWSAFSGGT
jgi:hypothetical protein